MSSVPHLTRRAPRWAGALACGIVTQTAIALTPLPPWTGHTTPFIADQYALIATPSNPSLETSLSLDRRHELRFSALSASHYTARLDGVLIQSLEIPRATYRYTLAASPQWTWKIGLTSHLSEAASLLRLGTQGSLNKQHWLSALPLLHMGGEAQFTQRWRLAVDADGLMTSNGYSLDIGLRLNYHLSPNFSLYGGWHLSDDEQNTLNTNAPTPSNSANVGLRLRF